MRNSRGWSAAQFTALCIAASCAILTCPAVAAETKPTPPPPTFTPCDTSDLQPMLAKGGLLHDYAPQAITIMRHRLEICRWIRDTYLSGQTAPPPQRVTAFDLPTPTPTLQPATCDPRKEQDPRNAVLTTYNALASCVQWIGLNVPSASANAPSASPSPPTVELASASNIDKGTVKIVYILALTADPALSAQVSLQLANQLLRRPGEPGYSYDQERVSYIPVAEPAWTLAQYQQQCYADRSTAGAIAIMQTSSQSRSWNYVLATASFTRIGMQAMVLDCEPTNTAYTRNVAHVTWFSTPQEYDGARGGFPLATALALAAGIAAFLPNKMENFTTVAPPLPPGSTYQSGYSISRNQGAGLAAGATVAALTPLAATTIGFGPGDAQAAASIRNGIQYGLLPAMQNYCAQHPDTAIPSPNQTPPAKKPSVPPMTHCSWFGWSK